MDSRLTVRYGGVPDLDRTVALQSGEIAPAGVNLKYEKLEATVELQSESAHDLEAFEMSLYDLLSLVSGGDTRVVGIPVFTARYLPSQLLWMPRGGDVNRPRDLAGRRVGYHSADKTTRIWVDAFLTNVHSVDSEQVEWIETDSEDELFSGQLDVDAVCLRPPAPDPRLMPVEAFDDANSAQLRALGGVVPIFHLVAIRRDVYAQHRWIAIEMMDAFIRAKFVGMKRLRYFGALGVGLPWLRRAVNDVDTNFHGDAYPYGLSENLDSLKQFISIASRAGLISDQVQPEDLFAPETADYPGVPNPTAYVVPLSGARAWS